MQTIQPVLIFDFSLILGKFWVISFHDILKMCDHHLFYEIISCFFTNLVTLDRHIRK